MDIRMLREEERPLARALWQYCFADPPDFAEWYFRRRAGDIIGMFDGGALAAQIVRVPMTIALRGSARGAAMLSGIATAPACRHRGHINALMRACLGMLRDEGCGAAVLYPFDYGFYRRYGFSPCGETARVKIALGRLPYVKPRGRILSLPGGGNAGRDGNSADSGHCTGSGTASRSPSSSNSAGSRSSGGGSAGGGHCAGNHSAAGDCAGLVRAYAASFSRYGGHVLRGEKEFALRLEELALDGGYAALYRRDGREEGYLLYHMRDKTLYVDEIGAASHTAREDLLSFLGSHASSMDTAELLCPLDDPLWRLLPDPRGAVTAEPFNMLRAVDIGAALSGLPAGGGEVLLRVRDPYAPWNEGLWRFFSSAGKLAAEKAAAPERGAGAANAPGLPGEAGIPDTSGLPGEALASADAADIADIADTAGVPTISVGDLSAWAFGCASAGDLIRRGVQLPPVCAKAMDALLPVQPFFLYETY